MIITFFFFFLHFQSSFHFAINLLAVFAQLEKVNKLCNNNHTMHVNDQNQIDHELYCSIWPTNNALISLKDGFAVWGQIQKEDFLSIIC